MTEPAVLGVELSLSGRRWRQRAADDRLGMALAQRLGVPEILGRVLAGRGVEPESAERFLNPTLREQLPDPSSFKDMDAAVARLVRAIVALSLINISEPTRLKRI
jgi:single-stranded-DNA-specific exonuclease